MSDYANMMRERDQLRTENDGLRAALEQIAGGARSPVDIAKGALQAAAPVSQQADAQTPTTREPPRMSLPTS